MSATSPINVVGAQTNCLDTVREAIKLLHPHGGVIEVRIPHTRRGTVSGYFDDMERLIQSVARWDGKANIYVTLNKIPRDLLARASNRLVEFAKHTTSDNDVLSRQWFPLDADPVRPAGISATDAEVRAALARRDEVVAFVVREGGFPEPFFAQSGNGGHAGWLVDLPNTPELTAFFRRSLKAIAERFDDARVTIDAGVYNAARIWKLYGTRACKGDATSDRPHRHAFIERIPASPVPVTLDQLQWLASLASEPPPRTCSLPLNTRKSPVNVMAYFQEQGWYLRSLSATKHAVRCPWQEAHSVVSGISETVLFAPEEDGALWGFKCFHNHCANRTIGDVLALLRASGLLKEATHNSRAPLVRASEIVAEPVSYCIDEVLPNAMLAILSGRDKLGKTLLALEMVKAVLLRQPFLDAFAVDGGGRVAAYLLDDPDSLTIDRLKALGIYDHPDLHVCTASRADLRDAGAILEDMVAEVKRVGAGFVVVDALYLFVPPGRESGNDVARMRPVMLALNRLAQETGATVLLIAHDNKSGVDVAGSYIIRASAKAILRLSLPKSAVEDDEDGPQTAYRVLRTETKMGPARSWTLEILGTPDKYKGWRCHGTTTEAKASETYRLVIACLEDKEPRTVAEIAAVIRRREQEVRDAVDKLVGEGKVEAIKGPPSGKKGRPSTRYQWRISPPEEDFPSGGREEKSVTQRPENTQLAVLVDFRSQSSSPRGSERDGKSLAGLAEVEL